MKYLLFSSLMLSLSGLASATGGTSQADYWLNKMSDAVNNLNYDGHFVYLHNNMLESLRTVHTVNDGRTTERLFSLNGEAREIVRDSQSVTSILPKQKKFSTAPRPLDRNTFSSFFRLDPQRINQNYAVSFKGKNRVADRMVNVVEFTPSDALRYGYRLFLDDEYALPLQWEMFDGNNQLVSSIMFTNINIDDPAPAAAVRSGLSAAESESVAPKKQRLRSTVKEPDSLWKFDQVPQGYQMHHYSSSMHHDDQRQIDHYLFSDGLASFSVYVEASDKVRLNGAAKLGALNAYGVFLDGYQLTAVGEVPIEALIFIGQSRKKP